MRGKGSRQPRTRSRSGAKRSTELRPAPTMAPRAPVSLIAPFHVPTQRLWRRSEAARRPFEAPCTEAVTAVRARRARLLIRSDRADWPSPLGRSVDVLFVLGLVRFCV